MDDLSHLPTDEALRVMAGNRPSFRWRSSRVVVWIATIFFGLFTPLAAGVALAAYGLWIGGFICLSFFVFYAAGLFVGIRTKQAL